MYAFYQVCKTDPFNKAFECTEMLQYEITTVNF